MNNIMKLGCNFMQSMPGKSSTAQAVLSRCSLHKLKNMDGCLTCGLQLFSQYMYFSIFKLVEG